jgi:hypothetical protein
MVTHSQPISEKKQLPSVAETTVTASLDTAVGAAFLASGIGSLVLGLAVVASEVSPAINTFLRWVGPVGPLSGKVGLSVIAFVLSWVGLHFYFRGRTLKLTTSFAVSLVLIAFGLALTFPPVFYWLHSVLVPN